MRAFLLILFLTAASGCSVLPGESRLSAVVAKPIMLDWGIQKNNPGHLMYQHDGIPGNIASMPGTLTPQNRPLAVMILGDPAPSGAKLNIQLLGVHELASTRGLVSTIIAAREAGEETISLESLEVSNSGALAVIEAGLVQLGDPGSRSLGFRSVEKARATITRMRQACRQADC